MHYLSKYSVGEMEMANILTHCFGGNFPRWTGDGNAFAAEHSAKGIVQTVENREREGEVGGKELTGRDA